MSATLLLATTGGHLGQLVDLSRRLPDPEPALWVTHLNEQSRSVLEGRSTEFVPYVRVRNVPDVLRCLPYAHRVWRDHRPVRAVSTGSGIALGYLPYLAARRVECHYIESAARVAGPSITGRLLQRFPGIHVHTQYPHWAGGRWTYGGSVFDGFEAGLRDTPPSSEPLRVVVTVGTAAEFPFRRLIARLAWLLAPNGPVAREVGRPVQVLWQTGCTPTEDLDLETTPFLPGPDLGRAVAAADLVVSHAGTGSALAALENGQCPVLVPRLRRHGEAGDDHQRELAAELERRGLGLHRDADDLTTDDLCAAMGTRIRRLAEPSPFRLHPGVAS